MMLFSYVDHKRLKIKVKAKQIHQIKQNLAVKTTTVKSASINSQ